MPATRASVTSTPLAGVRRFASPAVKAAIRRRLFEFLGLACGLAGLALLVALASYDAADPSLSTATTRRAANLVGPAGAMLADLLLQGFGWAAALPGVALLAWAWRLATHRGLGLFPARVAALLAALPVAGAALTLAPLPAGLPTAPGPAAPAAASPPAPCTTPRRPCSAPSAGCSPPPRWCWPRCCSASPRLALSPSEWLRLGRATQKGTVGVARAGGAGMRGAVGPPCPARPRPVRRPVPLPAPPRGEAGRRPVRRAARRRCRGRAAAAGRAASRASRRRPARRRRSAPAREPELKARIAQPAPPAKPRQVGAAGAAAARRRPLAAAAAVAAAGAPARRGTGPSEEALQANARLLEQVLDDYGVQGRIVAINPGPVVTLYELEPAPGTKSPASSAWPTTSPAHDVTAVRIATVPGRNVIGIELPNARRETVYFGEMMGSEDWTRHPGKLPLALGKDIGGNPVIADLARMPHLLIAGTTGSGKSVAINTMILSLLYRFGPEECRFIMIDPKMLELSVYDRIPHLLAPVVTEPPRRSAR